MHGKCQTRDEYYTGEGSGFVRGSSNCRLYLTGIESGVTDLERGLRVARERGEALHPRA